MELILTWEVGCGLIASCLCFLKGYICTLCFTNILNVELHMMYLSYLCKDYVSKSHGYPLKERER